MSWWDRIDKETLLELFRFGKLLAVGATAIAATFGLGTANEQVSRRDLRETELQAAVGNAQAETYGAFDNIRDYTMDVEVRKAACDSALEGLSRHRADKADFDHVVEKCHSKGVI